MEGEFGGKGQWQRPEQRDRMQMMGCAGRGVWLVFKNRQMEGCLRPRQTAKGHQGQSKKRLVCETRGVLGIQCAEEQARRFSQEGTAQQPRIQVHLFIHSTIIEKGIF